MVNVYVKQDLFDQKPLAKCICWQCGKVLWGKTGASASLVDPPIGKSACDVPASAFLRSVKDHSLTFQTEDRSKNLKWYTCSMCKTSKSIPLKHFVGDVLDQKDELKPVPLWDMSRPASLGSLCNRYEMEQISLCTMFCTMVKQANFSQWRHVQGKVNAMHKFDRHYCGMFGFLAIKEEDINVFSDNPNSALRIKCALRWLKANNHLYKTFYTDHENSIQICQASFCES